MRRTRSLIFVALLLAMLAACGGTAGPGGQVAPADPPATTVPSAAPASTSPASVPPVPSVAPVPTTTPLPTTPPAAPRSAAPSATPGPAPSAAPTSPSATTPRPNGPVPAGWQVYTGRRDFPFAIAYPPDWTVDDSLLPEQRIVYFYGPNGRDDDERIDLEIGQTGSGANIDVQRDEFFYRKSDFCDQKGIEFTDHRQISGATFAILGATCDSSNDLTFMQVASGLTGGDEWNILMRTYYDHKDERRRDVFDPMLATLNIYAQVP